MLYRWQVALFILVINNNYRWHGFSLLLLLFTSWKLLLNVIGHQHSTCREHHTTYIQQSCQSNKHSNLVSIDLPTPIHTRVLGGKALYEPHSVFRCMFRWSVEKKDKVVVWVKQLSISLSTMMGIPLFTQLSNAWIPFSYHPLDNQSLLPWISSFPFNYDKHSVFVSFITLSWGYSSFCYPITIDKLPFTVITSDHHPLCWFAIETYSLYQSCKLYPLRSIITWLWEMILLYCCRHSIWSHDFTAWDIEGYPNWSSFSEQIMGELAWSKMMVMI